MRVVDLELSSVIVEPRQTRPLGDLDALISSIEDVGLLHPIVVGTDHRLKVGFRRLEAFKRMDRDTIPAHLTDDLNDVIQALKAERDENVRREGLPPTVMVERARELEGLLKTPVGRPSDEIKENFLNLPQGQTRDKVGAALGVSGKTYEHARQVVAAAESDPEMFGDLPEKMDETSVHAAHREMRRRKREKEPGRQVLPASKSPLLIVSRAEDMPEVENESVDLIVTSSPYNLGDNRWPMGGDGREPRTDGIGYADDLDELAYQDWQVSCLIEFYRVAKFGASLFYNHKVRNIKGQIVHPMDWLRDGRNPWTIRQEIVWDRGSTHNHSASLFWPEDERVYWMTKGKPALPYRPIGMPSVWRFHGPVANTWHPAPFSEELPRRCIKAVGREGITVLDPFAGSCPTCKVALEYGYRAIGVDIEREYLERAAEEYGWMIPSST